LSDIAYSDVKQWLIEKAGRFSKDTCRLMIAAGRSVMQEACNDGLASANPFHGLARFYRHSEREDPDPFTHEEWKLVEAKIAKLYPEYLTMTHFMIGAGVRIGEAIGLKDGDIDWHQNRIKIGRTIPIHRKVERPKTAAGRRTLEIEQWLMDELKAHLAAKKVRVLAGDVRACDWVFCSTLGNPIDYSGFHKRWDAAQSTAKVRQRRPHDLRHTWASWALSEGKPLLWVSKQLGHSSPLVTLKIYAHWMPDEAKSATQMQPEAGENLK
jgi:integrase